MRMQIKQFAALTGVSVRALHYYDEIGLLKPDYVDANNGYRYYGDDAFSRMQQILFYKELSFSLEEIKRILSSADYDKAAALSGQKRLLLLKKQKLDEIIKAIECAEKGENIMVIGVNELESYKEEAKRRWGNTKEFAESEKKNTAPMYMKEGLDAIMAGFALSLKNGQSPKQAHFLVQELKDFISETQYNCTPQILLCLGEMYVGDERFKNNIDKHGAGTAEYINEAIKEYCK